MIIKKASLSVLLSFISLLANAGADVDFDGRDKEAKKIALQYAGAANSSQSDNSYTEEVPPELALKLEILTKAGELVEVKPRRPGTDSNRANFNQYSVRPGSKGKWTLFCQGRRWIRRVDYTSDPFYGGHGHDNTPPPVFVSSISLSASTAPVFAAPSPIGSDILQGLTTYYYWEQFPEFSTMFYEYPLGCGRTTNYIYVEVPDLVELPGGANYYYDHNPWESSAYHSENHYGTQKLIDTIKKVADTYKAAFPEADRLYIYDMSLLRGGLIDVNLDLKRPFYGHDTGIDADISKKLVPEENRRKLLEIMCANADTYSEQDVPGEVSYFHIRILKDAAGAPTERFMSDSRPAVKCCKGNEINPDFLQACMSTQPRAQ